MEMLYIVKGSKEGLDTYAICENKELANKIAVQMLEQSYVVLILPTPLTKDN